MEICDTIINCKFSNTIFKLKEICIPRNNYEFVQQEKILAGV